MIFTYATSQAAIDAIPKFCSEMEQDIFICHVCYPFGDEFSLRTRDQIMDCQSDRIIYEHYLPIDYKFIKRGNAIREQRVWEQRLNTTITIDPNIKERNGYPFVSHYTLIIKEDV